MGCLCCADLPVLMGEAGVHLSQLAHGQGGLVQWNNSSK